MRDTRPPSDLQQLSADRGKSGCRRTLAQAVADSENARTKYPARRARSEPHVRGDRRLGNGPRHATSQTGWSGRHGRWCCPSTVLGQGILGRGIRADSIAHVHRLLRSPGGIEVRADVRGNVENQTRRRDEFQPRPCDCCCDDVAPQAGVDNGNGPQALTGGAGPLPQLQRTGHLPAAWRTRHRDHPTHQVMTCARPPAVQPDRGISLRWRPTIRRGE